jgi:glycosyltransferase involved in cell wall biosynthesis
VTLVLISYNQEGFIRVAAESCLSQDYKGPLEVIFSDDFSTDSTFKIMKGVADAYVGPSKIILRRNPKNIGIGEHYNTIISISTGDLIITAAGDDISLPHRVGRIVECWIDKNKEPDLITSNLIEMTLNGDISSEINVSNLADWKTPESWVKKRPYVVGAAHAFTPRLHRKFGNFVPNLVYEDQVMTFRATLMGGGAKKFRPH